MFLSHNNVADRFVRTSDSNLETLRLRYDALLAVIRQVEGCADQAVSAYKLRVGGGKRPDALKDQRLYLEREHHYELAVMALKITATGGLRSLASSLREECFWLREFDRATPTGDLPAGANRDHLRANVLVSEALCDTAAEYLRKYANIWTGCLATDELFAEPPAEAAEWLVQTSGHGGPYEFDNKDNRVPDGPYMTRAAANTEALRLAREFTCVGAQFRIINVHTGKHHAPSYK